MLLLDPAAKVAAPTTLNASLSVIAPDDVTDNVPEIVEAPKTIAPVSFSVTLLPEVIATVEKLLLLFNVISLLAPAAKVVVPVTAKLPLSVMAPDALTMNVLEIVDAPKSIALIS